MPEQPGHYPCGPAETTPVTPAKESKETEIKEDPNARHRSKRARTFIVEKNADRLPANPSSSTRIPLFPFSLLLFGGYRRISKKNVLDQNTRNLIYHAISSNPGIDVPTLVRKTGINENTLRYHLVKLIKSGRITYLIKPGVIRYFLNQGSFSLPEQVLIHYMRSETPRNILYLLDHSPGITRQQISDALGISGPSVTRQMEHLIEDRIIENRWPGRSNHYYLTDEAMRIFKHLISDAMTQGGSLHSMSVRAEGVVPEPPAVY
jgi:DNA-binding transcriptional ArsR family regulator